MNRIIEELASGGVHGKALELVAGLPGTRVLDAPAGHGALTEKLLAMGKVVTAADIEIGKFRLGADTPNLSLIELDLNERFRLDRGAYDIVVCLEGIEHLKNQWNPIECFHHALRDGGHLLLSTPNIVNFRSRARFFLEARYEFFKRPLVAGKSVPHDVEVGHIAPVSYFELQYILSSCGFNVVGLHANKYSSKNIVSMMLRPLFRWAYAHKNRRDARRNRGEFIDLYRTIMSDELYYGETLIVVARKTG